MNKQNEIKIFSDTNPDIVSLSINILPNESSENYSPLNYGKSNSVPSVKQKSSFTEPLRKKLMKVKQQLPLGLESTEQFIESKMCLNINSNLSNESSTHLNQPKFEKELMEEKIQSEAQRLKEENERLTNLLNQLKSEVIKLSELDSYEKNRLTFSKLKKNPDLLYYYIGSKCLKFLEVMISKVSDYCSHSIKDSSLLLQDQLLITLMKLRRNYPVKDLAFRFKISNQETENTILKQIKILHILYHINYEKNHNQTTDLNLSISDSKNGRLLLESVNVQCTTDNDSDNHSALKGFIVVSNEREILGSTKLLPKQQLNSYDLRNWKLLKNFEHNQSIVMDKGLAKAVLLPDHLKVNVPDDDSKCEKNVKRNFKIRAFTAKTTLQHLRKFSILSSIPLFLNPLSTEIFQLCVSLVNLEAFSSSIN